MTCVNPAKRPSDASRGRPTPLDDNMQNRRIRRWRSALDYQPLESRCALSASGFGGVDPHFNDPSTQRMAFQEQSAQAEIPYLVVQINDQVRTLRGDPLLVLNGGDRLAVLGVGVESGLDQGIFAAEGYISKLTDGASPSSLDYNDGRFSAREDNLPANGRGGEIGGLQGGWQVQEGWDRLTVSLVHYTEQGSENVASFRLRLQVEVADFAFDTSVFDRWAEQTFATGETIEIPGTWKNLGGGIHHNYAEADVFDTASGEQIVWAGALAGNSGGAISGVFTNTRDGDGFDHQFTPQKAGEYVVRFTVDPEFITVETDESNNEYEVTIKVEDPVGESRPVAVADHYSSGRRGFVRGRVTRNDWHPDGKSFWVHAYSQPENGRLRMLDNGRFVYRPDPGFAGQDSFTYSITDGQQVSDTVQVTLDVRRGHRPWRPWGHSPTAPTTGNPPGDAPTDRSNLRGPQFSRAVTTVVLCGGQSNFHRINSQHLNAAMDEFNSRGSVAAMQSSAPVPGNNVSPADSESDFPISRKPPAHDAATPDPDSREPGGRRKKGNGYDKNRRKGHSSSDVEVNAHITTLTSRNRPTHNNA